MDFDYINVSEELRKLEEQLKGKEIISTIDLALIYNMCDKYIKSILGRDIITLFDEVSSSPEEITRHIMLCLFSNQEILNFISSYNISNILANVIYNIGNKKILTITDSVIQNSGKMPNQVPIPSDSSRIKRIFQSLRRNYELYQELYKDKIWLIDSTNLNGNKIVNTRIKITPYMFFHLMGFDYANVLNPLASDKNGIDHNQIGHEFARYFKDSSKAFKILEDFGNDVSKQYQLIEMLLEEENRFLEIATNGKLINPDKVEMKCFAFERMGVVQSASGMILFDKQKAIDLGYKKEVQYIESDIILLNDFLRRYDINFGLDFVISPYAKPKDKLPEFQKQNIIRDQQSIFLTKQPGGGFNSHLFDQQKASISSSVAGYRANDFNYSITEKGGDDKNPQGEPLYFKEFSEEERKKAAQAMSEAFPDLDKEYLDELTNANKLS